MTSFELERFTFDKESLGAWSLLSERHNNWPVVYLINNEQEIYVGETSNAELRMRQHLASIARAHLQEVKVIVHDSFNKSACLDLESHLIRYFHADEKYLVQNLNGGITDSDYFDRQKYLALFDEIFENLVTSGELTRSIPELINSDLFKYSPFKSLTTDQASAIEEVLEFFFDSLDGNKVAPPVVIQGDPGTGKTIVAVYLMKILRDISRVAPDEAVSVDSAFVDFFQEGYREKAKDLKIGLVIPQISLRKTLRKVFSRTPGLDQQMVLEPFEVGKSSEVYDLLIVDEAHRLQIRNNQPAGQRNKDFRLINETLFGHDDLKFTQLDWIRSRSKNQIFLLDSAQTVKPADLDSRTINNLVHISKEQHSLFRLTSQMRVQGGEDYIKYVGDVLKGNYSGPRKNFGDYEFKLFSSFSEMQKQILQRNSEVGLCRLIAGYAWPWVTKTGADFDIEIEGIKLPWNRTDTDWINSPTSLEEVGSIHTVQGYDLNFAGVIIGPDLGYDRENSRIVFRRENYHDKKGKENNIKKGIVFSDEDLFDFVTNIYRVLLTRGIKGTYVYVVDPALRSYLAKYF